MLDFNNIVVLAIQNTFARPIVITPYASQPGVGPYNGRGVFITGAIDVPTEAGVVFSDQRTMLDIRVSEYPVPPVVMDWVMIPAHMSMPAKGPYQIMDIDEFPDGKVTMTLREAVIDEPRQVS